MPCSLLFVKKVRVALVFHLNQNSNQVSRLSMRSAPLARKSGCLHICLHNEVVCFKFCN